MSQIGLNSNIYNISNKYLEKFNDFLAVLNYSPESITEQQRTELRNIVTHLLDKDSLDYQIQMVYMIIDDYLKENNKKSSLVLNQLRSFLEKKAGSLDSAIKSLELITNALDQECDYAFSRIQKR
ncbi:MAG TPA: hypothetical protein ENJ95_10715 [Bacteroidetes bacterium]|nr:hypothetical protein [Bacteroidota bacterium]